MRELLIRPIPHILRFLSFLAFLVGLSTSKDLVNEQNNNQDPFSSHQQYRSETYWRDLSFQMNALTIKPKDAWIIALNTALEADHELAQQNNNKQIIDFVFLKLSSYLSSTPEDTPENASQKLNEQVLLAQKYKINLDSVKESILKGEQFEIDTRLLSKNLEEFGLTKEFNRYPFDGPSFTLYHLSVLTKLSMRKSKVMTQVLPRVIVQLNLLGKVLNEPLLKGFDKEIRDLDSDQQIEKDQKVVNEQARWESQFVNAVLCNFKRDIEKKVDLQKLNFLDLFKAKTTKKIMKMNKKYQTSNTQNKNYEVVKKVNKIWKKKANQLRKDHKKQLKEFMKSISLEDRNFQHLPQESPKTPLQNYQKASKSSKSPSRPKELFKFNQIFQGRQCAECEKTLITVCQTIKSMDEPKQSLKTFSNNYLKKKYTKLQQQSQNLEYFKEIADDNMRIYQMHAENGIDFYQNHLAFIHQMGEHQAGIPRNQQQAEFWARKASANDHFQSKCMLNMFKLRQINQRTPQSPSEEIPKLQEEELNDRIKLVKMGENCCLEKKEFELKQQRAQFCNETAFSHYQGILNQDMDQFQESRKKSMQFFRLSYDLDPHSFKYVYVQVVIMHQDQSFSNEEKVHAYKTLVKEIQKKNIDYIYVFINFYLNNQTKSGLQEYLRHHNLCENLVATLYRALDMTTSAQALQMSKDHQKEGKLSMALGLGLQHLFLKFHSQISNLQYYLVQDYSPSQMSSYSNQAVSINHDVVRRKSKFNKEAMMFLFSFYNLQLGDYKQLLLIGLQFLKGFKIQSQAFEGQRQMEGVYLKDQKIGVNYLEEYLKIYQRDYYIRTKVAWIYFVGKGNVKPDRKKAYKLIEKNLEDWSFKDKKKEYSKMRVEDAVAVYSFKLIMDLISFLGVDVKRLPAFILNAL